MQQCEWKTPRLDPLRFCSVQVLGLPVYSLGVRTPGYVSLL